MAALRTLLSRAGNTLFLQNKAAPSHFAARGMATKASVSGIPVEVGAGCQIQAMDRLRPFDLPLLPCLLSPLASYSLTCRCTTPMAISVLS